jgi:hypothetical protein
MSLSIPLKEGSFMKLGAIFKSWKTRCFRLYEATLEYQKAGQKRILGTIDPASITSIALPSHVESGEYPILKVEVRGRVYQFKFHSMVEAQAWTDAIQEAWDRLNHRQRSLSTEDATPKIGRHDFITFRELASNPYGILELVQSKCDKTL